jgi:hypothetical protein
MGSAYRRAHMLQCNLSVRVHFSEVWKRLVPAASLTTVRELAAAQGAAEDDLVLHRPVCRGSSREVAAQGLASTKARTKL